MFSARRSIDKSACFTPSSTKTGFQRAHIELQKFTPRDPAPSSSSSEPSSVLAGVVGRVEAGAAPTPIRRLGDAEFRVVEGPRGRAQYLPRGMGGATTRSNIPSNSISIGEAHLASNVSEVSSEVSSSLVRSLVVVRVGRRAPAVVGRAQRREGAGSARPFGAPRSAASTWKLRPKRAASYAGSSSRELKKYK